MGCPIDMERNGCESPECWTRVVTFNFDLTHPWPWPCIFNDKFWNSCIPGIGGPINMERKGVIPTFWPWAMTMTLDFHGKILKMLYIRDGRADWHGTNGMWFDRMLDSHCDFVLLLHPWHWPWIFKVKFWNSCISGTGGPITMERWGYESIRCYTYYVTLSNVFDLGFRRSNFKKSSIIGIRG